MPNHLTTSTSAYLQSASHQPIHWHPWGSAAFATARASDRPVLLDIGAVWCHWCHVMDGESYEDPKLAEFLNDNFVCVKVDRDERPDVDTRYQRAVQAITGQGGWPLTAFLTPDGEVFYGGTYFPPDGKYGRPGFRAVLDQVLTVYRTQRDRVTSQSEALKRMLEEHLDEAARGEVNEALLEEATEAMARVFDFRDGGFGTQPKFPHPAALIFLLHRYTHQRADWIREILDKTLQGMARGGIHDHLGGGFHRYSVDARWVVPHFEKMSYDNSELLKAYLDAHAAFGTKEYAEVARGVVRWVREILADPDGGYGASQDADVGLHDDGDYFTWTLDEVRAVLTEEELAVAVPYYDIGTAGEMHHNPAKNVLHLGEPLESIAQRLGLDSKSAAERLKDAEAKLRAARDLRTAPFIDRTRYTNWNGMLSSALLRAGAVLDDAWATTHALATLNRIRGEQLDATALKHAPGGIGGLLDDQVQVAQAALDAFEYTGESSWLEWARALMERVWNDYRDEKGGGLYDTAVSQGGEGLLPTRAKPVQDAPTPSPNGVAALCCARLAELDGNSPWPARRDELVAAFAARAGELGLHAATFLLAVEWSLHPATHVVVVADGESDSIADQMAVATLRTFLPRRVLQRITRGQNAALTLPAAVQAMADLSSGATAYLCVGTSCQPPARTLGEWQERIREWKLE